MIIQQKQIDEDILKESIILNRFFLKLPFPTKTKDYNLVIGHDIMKFYRSCLEGETIELNKSLTEYHIDQSKETYTDWESWYKQVVWYGNKKGAYLYGNWETEYQLSGHH